MKKSFITATAIILVVALAGSGIWYAISLGAAAAPVESKISVISVGVTTPTLGDITINGEFVATVQPDSQVIVLPKVSGAVLKTNFKVGEKIEAGETLFEIDPTDIKLQVAIVEAAYNSAKAAVSSATGGTFNAQLLQAEAGLQNAANGLDTAERLLNETKYNYSKQLDSLDDTRDELDSATSIMGSNIRAMQQQLGALNAEYQPLYEAYMEDAKPYNDQIDELRAEIKVLQAEIDEHRQGDPIDQSYIDSRNDEIEAKIKKITSLDETIAKLGSGSNTKITELREQITALNSNLSSAQGAMSSAMSAYNQADSGYNQLDRSKDIDLERLQSSVIAAQIARDTAEKNYSILTEEIKTQSLATANAQLKQAEAQLNASKAQLTYASVTSPISGTVTQKLVSDHDLVGPTMACYIVSNEDIMVVSFGVPEAVMLTLNLDDEVTIKKNGETCSGKITEIANATSPSSALFVVKARIENAPFKLFAGSSVKLTTEINRASRVLTIPIDALYYEAGKPYLFVANEGTAKKTYVETGLSNDTHIEIISGVTTTDSIVSTWSPHLKDGMLIDTNAGGETK